MKKTVLVVGGLIALGVLFDGGRSWAQQAASPPQTAPRTRIALLNMNYVIKNYEKSKLFEKEVTSAAEPFVTKLTNLRKQLEALSKQAAEMKPGSLEHFKLEHQAKEIQRQMEDIQQEAKGTIGKMNDEDMLAVYKDVYEAARRYAVSHEFDLVLHYNDAITEQDFMSPRNISVKLHTMSLIPLYVSPGMDISQAVVATLNYNLRPATPGGAAPGAPPRANAFNLLHIATLV